MLKEHYLCCGFECIEVKSKSTDGIEFCCTHCLHHYSIRSGSFFFNVHVPLTILLSLTYLFAAQNSVSSAFSHVKGKASRQFVTLWFGRLQNILSRSLLRDGIRLGGPGHTVEIDESALGRKRKFMRGYHRGSGLKWVIGLIDRVTKKCHIEWVPDWTRETVFPIICRHVIPGTQIHTDEARIYATLNQEGFEHRTVCHNDNYVDPVDGTHTNAIENFWSHLKIKVCKLYGVQNQNLGAHLDEHIFRWNYKFDGPMYELLLQEISQHYAI